MSDPNSAYHFPDTFADMTIQPFTLNADEDFSSVGEYLDNRVFALTADLVQAGFAPPDVEAAVNLSTVQATHWPAKDPLTDFYWSATDFATKQLQELAELARDNCGGKDAQDAIGGDFVGVGNYLGSQQLALAGLIYAREQNLVREIPGLGHNQTPLYVPVGSFSDQMFAILMPEVNGPLN